MDPIITAKIFATIGNNSSLIPLGIKDVSNTLGMTAGSYITGNKVEGKDRFIDEFGTQIIWLMGIPFFKKVIDKTVYKIAKFNPNIDVRLLKDPEMFKRAKAHALPALKEGFEKVEKNQKLFKGLAIAKFAVSTALTLASYSALTTFRHKHTEKAIIDEFKKEEQLKKANENFVKNSSSVTFKSFGNKQQQKPSFGMNMNVLNKFMFDPVKNTMIVDGGISTERLAESRNPQDFMGYVIKEGGFWAFMYFVGPAIQKYLEKKAAKGGKPIDLDIRVLQDKKFQKEIKNMSEKDIKKMAENLKLDKSDAEIYDALYENSDNLIVKMAKKSEIIKTVKENDKAGKEIAKELQQIDSQHYIDIDAIKGIKAKIETLYTKAPKTKETFDDFFKEIIKLKQVSIIKNIGYSIGALGILVPGIMVAMRFLNKDNKEFQVKKEIHEKLRQENNFA